MKLIALSCVEYLDPETKERIIAEVDHPLNVDDAVGKKLLKKRAARTPTDDELKLMAVKSMSREDVEAAFKKASTPKKSRKPRQSKKKSADDVV